MFTQPEGFRLFTHTCDVTTYNVTGRLPMIRLHAYVSPVCDRESVSFQFTEPSRTTPLRFAVDSPALPAPVPTRPTPRKGCCPDSACDVMPAAALHPQRGVACVSRALRAWLCGFGQSDHQRPVGAMCDATRFQHLSVNAVDLATPCRVDGRYAATPPTGGPVPFAHRPSAGTRRFVVVRCTPCGPDFGTGMGCGA
jgi:hypothetical protein